MSIDLGTFNHSGIKLSYKDGAFGFDGPIPSAATLKNSISTIFDDVRPYFQRFVSGSLLINRLENWIKDAPDEHCTRFSFATGIELVQAMFTVQKQDPTVYQYLKARFQPVNQDDNALKTVKAVAQQCLREWKQHILIVLHDPCEHEFVGEFKGKTINLRIKFDVRKNGFVLVRGNPEVKLCRDYLKAKYFPDLSEDDRKVTDLSKLYVSSNSKTLPVRVLGIYASFIKMLYIHSKPSPWQHTLSHSIEKMDKHLSNVFYAIMRLEENNNTLKKDLWGEKALEALLKCRNKRQTNPTARSGSEIPPRNSGGYGDSLREGQQRGALKNSPTEAIYYSSLPSTHRPRLPQGNQLSSSDVHMPQGRMNDSSAAAILEELFTDGAPKPRAEGKPPPFHEVKTYPGPGLENRGSAPITDDYQALPRSGFSKGKSEYEILPDNKDTSDSTGEDPEYAILHLEHKPEQAVNVQGPKRRQVGVIPPRVRPLEPESDYYKLGDLKKESPDSLPRNGRSSPPSGRRGSFRRREPGDDYLIIPTGKSNQRKPDGNDTRHPTPEETDYLVFDGGHKPKQGGIVPPQAQSLVSKKSPDSPPKKRRNSKRKSSRISRRGSTGLRRSGSVNGSAKKSGGK